MTVIITHFAAWFKSSDACEQACNELKHIKIEALERRFSSSENHRRHSHLNRDLNHPVYIEFCESDESFLTGCISYRKNELAPQTFINFLVSSEAELVSTRTGDQYFGSDVVQNQQGKKKISAEQAWRGFSKKDLSTATYVAIILDMPTDVIDIMLAKGVSANESVCKRPLIELAADMGQHDTVNLFLQHGAKADAASFIETQSDNIFTHKGDTALHHAVMLDNSALVRELLKQKPNLNKVNSSGNTPLHEAILAERCYENVHLLITVGADLSICNKTGLTPFLLLMEGDTHDTEELIQIAKAMLKQGVSINQTCREGGNALWYAAHNQRLLTFLNQQGLTQVVAPANTYSGDLFSDIDTAIRVNDTQFCKLKKDTLKTSLTPVQKNQLLYAAIDYNRTFIVKHLIQAGADTHYTTSNGRTLIDLANEKNNSEIMDLLCEPS